VAGEPVVTVVMVRPTAERPMSAAAADKVEVV